MLHRRALPSMLILAALLTAPAFAQEMRGFTTEIALDVKSPRIVAMSEDGRRIVVTVRTGQGRASVDHARVGDPTYVAAVTPPPGVVPTLAGGGLSGWVMALSDLRGQPTERGEKSTYNRT